MLTGAAPSQLIPHCAICLSRFDRDICLLHARVQQARAHLIFTRPFCPFVFFIAQCYMNLPLTNIGFVPQSSG